MRCCHIHAHWVLLLALISCRIHTVESISRCNQHVLAPSIPRSLDRQKNLLASSRRSSRYHYGRSDFVDPLQRTLPVARKKKEKASKEEPSPDKIAPTTEKDPFATPMTTQEIYANMGPVGRTVAGTVEIAVSVCMEYVTGFLGGFTIGSVVGLPGFAFKSMNTEQRLPFKQEFSKRFGRMNSKSVRWAKTWGSISATFGGCRVATRVIRGGKEDEWNTVFSSAAAGAFFARKEGPQAMLRAAVTYGGMIYLLSGGMGGKKQPFDYNDEPIDF